MTPPSHPAAEVARQAIAAVQARGYDIQFGHCACTALVESIAAALEAARRDERERCAKLCEAEAVTSQRSAQNQDGELRHRRLAYMAQSEYLAHAIRRQPATPHAGEVGR